MKRKLKRVYMRVSCYLGNVSRWAGNLRVPSRIQWGLTDRQGRGGSRGGGGGPTGAPPKIWSTIFKILFCIRMLKNKAQIARKSIKTLELLRGLWSLDPGRRGFSLFAIVMCARTIILYNLLRPPPPKWKSWIRPCMRRVKFFGCVHMG